MSHISNLMSHIKSDLTARGAADTVDSPDSAPHDTIDEWGVFACTTEALVAAKESEARLLGQTLAGAKAPNDLGFADYESDRVSEVAAAAQGAGFGFGEQGTAAGRFYDRPRSPMAPPIQISSNEPR